MRTTAILVAAGICMLAVPMIAPGGSDPENEKHDKDIQPTGRGIGTRQAPGQIKEAPGNKPGGGGGDNGIQYHGGPVLVNGATIVLTSDHLLINNLLVTIDASSLAAGQKIYSKTCAMCHGKTGDADGPAVIELNIHPAKLSDPKLATEPDGSLFWKITTGKKPMPTYGKRLSETDRWNLVNYVRTLSKR